MFDSIFLAWHYLRHHLFTTMVLLASITLIVYLPAALQTIVTNAEKHFRSRADLTPLIVGPRGSPLELVLASVYFDKPYEQSMPYEEFKRIDEQKRGIAIPLHVRFLARDCQVVGTDMNYVETRNLRVEEGNAWDLLGECLVGARAATRLRIQVGDKIPVSSSSTFVLDNPPLRLRVAGILAPNETPDDEVIFVSLATAWIIEGLGHGHTKGTEHGTPEAELFTDITSENVDSFHFHGDRNRFPITAVFAIPNSDKDKTVLLGQYFSSDETVQIVRPPEVLDGLLQRVIMIRSYMVAVIVVVAAVTLLLMALVIILSIRLRRAEIVTMTKMGCSRHRIAMILGWQIVIILVVGCGIAAGMTVATNYYGPTLVRMLIL